MDLQNQLIGALIGLARATDGSEHLITPESTAVVAECLAAVSADDGQLQRLLASVDAAKRKMVPGCFACANPCGRTSEYHMEDILKEGEDVRRLKLQILDGIRTLAASESHYDSNILYKALIVIGMDDYTAEDLMPILQEITEK